MRADRSRTTGTTPGRELDRWLAPIYKLEVPTRYKAMCAAGDKLRAKAMELKPLGPPGGGDAQAWSDATDGLAAQIDGVGCADRT